MDDLDDEIVRLWALYGGLRDSLERLSGRFEEHVAGCGAAAVPEAEAEKEREAEEARLDALRKAREARGKSEELDEEDLREIGEAWLGL